jgi:uncharacterized protein (TIGR03663 family)
VTRPGRGFGPVAVPAVGSALRETRSRPRVAFGRYEACFAGVVAVGLVLRVVDVTAKPFHHDESEHAWFTWLLVTGHGYHYNPVFHGPVQFYFMSLLYLLIGAGDLAARLAPALVGTAVVALPYLLRRQIGRAGALAAAVILCLSPSFLYFSRFVREDIYAACLTLALVAAIFRFLARPRRRHPSLIFALLAVSFATKETTYITVFIFGLFFAGLAAWELRTGRCTREGSLIRAVLQVGRDAWIWAVATFATVFMLLFTTFLTNPRGLQDGIVESIRYWLSQQPVNRGAQPWFYYLVILPGYEWPVLLLALVGVVAVARRPTVLGAFLIWMFVTSLIVYSWASERMPWLILHPLLPAVLLAGIGFQTLWGARGTLVGKAGLAFVAIGAVYSIQAGLNLAYVRPADPRELLVYTQISTDVPGVVTEIGSLNRTVPDRLHRPLRLEVDSWAGTGWPWGWYLRNVPTAYPDMSQADYSPTGDVVLVAEPDQRRLAGRLRDYTGRRFRLRVWWVPDWGGATLTDWARWLLLRHRWGPEGTLDEWLYVRRSLYGAGSPFHRERPEPAPGTARS